MIKKCFFLHFYLVFAKGINEGRKRTEIHNAIRFSKG